MKRLIAVIAVAASGSAFALSEAAQIEQLEARVAQLEKRIAKLESAPASSVSTSANVPSKDYKAALDRIGAIQFSINNKKLADDDFAELSEASKAVYLEEFGGLTNDLAAAKKALADLEASMAPDELSKVKKYEEAHREIRQARGSGFRKRMDEKKKKDAEAAAISDANHNVFMYKSGLGLLKGSEVQLRRAELKPEEVAALSDDLKQAYQKKMERMRGACEKYKAQVEQYGKLLTPEQLKKVTDEIKQEEAEEEIRKKTSKLRLKDRPLPVIRPRITRPTTEEPAK